MLIIRQQQMETFRKAALAAFETEMVLHCNEFSPHLYKVIGEKQMRVAVCRTIDRAYGHGFTNRGPIRLFIEMMLLFGSNFDTDPQYSWAAKILHTSDDQMQRAEQLYNKILDYQEKVSGPDAANTLKSLEELSVLVQKPVTFSANNFVTGICKEITSVFPQKAAYIGEDGLTALIHKGSTEARSYSFSTVRGEASMVVLMFAFGHGCTDDPLYPWIARTLKDHRIIPTLRSERLERKARTWLDHVLSSFREGIET